MRLIDADGLKKLTTERNEIWNAVTDSRGRGLTEIIDSLPAVDVAPVVHAHWVADDGELYCSNCEWTPEVLGGTTLGDLQLADVYHCPHCGAKMDEEGCFDGCT